MPVVGLGVLVGACRFDRFKVSAESRSLMQPVYGSCCQKIARVILGVTHNIDLIRLVV